MNPRDSVFCDENGFRKSIQNLFVDAPLEYVLRPFSSVTFLPILPAARSA